MTNESNEKKQPIENVKTPKLSLISEDPSSRGNSQPEAQASGPSNPELTPAERKHMEKVMRQMQKKGIALPPGSTWNPLLKLEPNRLCPCLSEKKFKACCRDKLAMVVPVNVAEEFEKQMAREDLVFLTPENHDKIQARIAPHVKANLEKQQAEQNERAAYEKRKIDDALSKSKR